MERLTKPAEKNRGNAYTSAIGSGYGAWPRIIQRLAAYENTGLEPEEIMAAPKWIPTTERLPENSDFVLVIATGQLEKIYLEQAFEFASYSEDEGWILEMWPEMENPVISYWMPIPDRPEV